MAKLRVFVSSTYYDLKHIRRNLENFIEDMGYEAVLFESGDIPFEHNQELDDSCYKELENCQMQILIIGNRYGSPASSEHVGPQEGVADDMVKKYEFYNSVTKKEFLKAQSLGVPIFIFAEKNVLSEYETYKKNKGLNITWAHVDNICVFKLLDDLYNAKSGFIKDFENFDDIQNWLKEQWSGIFANYIMKRSSEIEVKNLASQVNELQTVTNALKQYSEAILRELKPEKFEGLIKDEEKKITETTLLNRLSRISYVKHLMHTHNFEIEFLHELLTKSKTHKEFKEKLFEKDGGSFSCIDTRSNKKSLNEARAILGLSKFPDVIILPMAPPKEGK